MPRASSFWRHCGSTGVMASSAKQSFPLRSCKLWVTEKSYIRQAMTLENFAFGNDNISIEWKGVYLDLHNCFDFSGLQYQVSDQAVFLCWQRSPESWAQSTPITGFKLVFNQVVYFRITSRDAEYPFSEDTCLRDLSFVPQAERDDFDNVYSLKDRTQSDDLKFVFQSEFGIKLNAHTVTFVVSE